MCMIVLINTCMHNNKLLLQSAYVVSLSMQCNQSDHMLGSRKLHMVTLTCHPTGSYFVTLLIYLTHRQSTQLYHGLYLFNFKPRVVIITLLYLDMWFHKTSRVGEVTICWINLQRGGKWQSSISGPHKIMTKQLVTKSANSLSLTFAT